MSISPDTPISPAELTSPGVVDALAAGDLVMYSTSWCGFCIRLKSQLQRVGVGMHVVNLEEDADAEEFVRRVNGGNAVVPTVVFPGGLVRTNPTYAQCLELLAAA